MRFALPAFWLVVAAGVYAYNTGDQGKIVMFGLEYVVGDDLEVRGLATVGIALFFAAVTGVQPVLGLFRGAPEDDD